MGKKILSEVCTQILSDKTYEKATMEDSSKIVAEVVREKLKELNLPRYKFIVEVIVAEARGQGMCVNSACMWDSDTDNVVNHLYTNTNLFCEAIIFAVFNY